eukprot:6198518-Pleurochrysis_carterae.AAC.5
MESRLPESTRSQQRYEGSGRVRQNITRSSGSLLAQDSPLPPPPVNSKRSLLAAGDAAVD